MVQTYALTMGSSGLNDIRLWQLLHGASNYGFPITAKRINKKKGGDTLSRYFSCVSLVRYQSFDVFKLYHLYLLAGGT